MDAEQIKSGITVNECYRIFIRQTSKANRDRVIERTRNILDIMDWCRFLELTTKWLSEQLEKAIQNK